MTLLVNQLQKSKIIRDFLEDKILELQEIDLKTPYELNLIEFLNDEYVRYNSKIDELVKLYF